LNTAANGTWQDLRFLTSVIQGKNLKGWLIMDRIVDGVNGDPA